MSYARSVLTGNGSSALRLMFIRRRVLSAEELRGSSQSGPEIHTWTSWAGPCTTHTLYIQVGE